MRTWISVLWGSMFPINMLVMNRRRKGDCVWVPLPAAHEDIATPNETNREVWDRLGG